MATEGLGVGNSDPASTWHLIGALDAADVAELLDAVPDGLVVVDRVGRVLYVNQHLETMFGYPAADLVGAAIEMLLPVDARALHEHHRASFVASPRARAMGSGLTLHGRHRDGREFPIEVSLNALGAGDTMRVIATVRDVADRVAADQERRRLLDDVRSAYKHLDAVIATINDGLIEVGADGRIVTVNDRFLGIIGYARDEVMALHSPYPWWPTESQGLARANRPTDGPSKYEAVIVNRGGRKVPVHIQRSAIKDGAGDLVIVRDLTDEKHAAAELHHARTLVTLAAERDRIARDLHDRVIQRIFGVGLAIQADVGRCHDADLARRLEQRVADLDDAIHELRTSIFELHTRPTEDRDVRDVVREVVNAAARVLGFQPQVVVDGSLNIPQHVIVELEAALRESLSNVAKHAQALTCTVELFAQRGDLVLSITDDGCGIDPSAPRGSGLDNLVERAVRLGGSCEVSARRPTGTVVLWTVPVKDLQRPAHLG